MTRAAPNSRPAATHGGAPRDHRALDSVAAHVLASRVMTEPRENAGGPRRVVGAVVGAVDGLARAALRGVVRAYQLLLSPLLPPMCRHEPSCSRYAMEALRVHSAPRAVWLIVRRLARCHPWGKAGPDPVPPPREKLAAGGEQH